VLKASLWKKPDGHRCTLRHSSRWTMSEDTLRHHLLSDPEKRPPILDDCLKVLDDEVASKRGVSGLAIKGAFKVVQKVKPGFVREVMDDLLDDFVERIEPFYAEHRDLGDKSGKSFSDFVISHGSNVSDALLGITDDRAKRAQNKGVKGAYNKLRPTAKKHVQEAMPRVARMLQKHLPA
jgi:hypothetical protein